MSRGPWLLLTTILGLSLLACLCGGDDEATTPGAATTTTGDGKPSAGGGVQVVDELPKSSGPTFECKEEVSSPGAMLESVIKEYEKKTEIQKEGWLEAKEKEWKEKGYCGVITGTVSDVGIDSFMGCAESPSGMDGYIEVENINGRKYRTARVFMSEEKLKADFATLDIGSKVKIDAYIYLFEPLLNGYVCGALREPTEPEKATP
ncbi:MAG: hypothetical protein GY913_28875 [Proteobacteria bacterium]|nr:hypothetical protein [Pseudomonadota bacterium]